ncbi:hypothetical protein SERLA73DRAFT_64084 [Serpula lacrymans var. lacrymans S7.3]|uniref:SNF2 N-terminal domain-containing protein n=1 Tax=Serpula lacrymans var. lacrymans (strain S7.3) TaxID=936435 RepID=F8QE79_SERL3|nr:hypothetical protein SERLA73DRAFT_64084 [Serpula lacrymans var. lacrymans S7.3]
MPHPLRAKSGGRLILTVPLIVFMDDVSENISKQWNKHHVVYMLNTSIPRNMIEKEFCIHFVVSSPHAAPMELMKGVTDSICKAEKTGIITWDCQYEEEIMLIPYELFVAGDNPMHAKECSHAGLKTNHFCRRCKVGETQVEKKSDKGYQKLFQSGSPRLPQETIEEGLRQDSLSLESGGTDKVKKAATSTGIRDAASVSVVQHLLELGKQLRKHVPGKAALPEADVCKLTLNPLLGMPGMDIHQDTPTKILHTVLLGVAKYFWGQTVWLLDEAHLLTTFQRCLESINKDGLNYPTLGAEYICRFKGSLIGKHFKSLAQVMPYLIYNLVSSDVLDGWTVLGDLIVLLWHTRIDNTNEYLVRISMTKS